MTPITVVRAAAGCGKTTDLACRYLGLLARGLPAERIIAITFTRRAAAELTERISRALRACLGDPEAAAQLGGAWSRYQPHVPEDPALARAALADLGHAPIGTTDGFIQQLLVQHALDLELPVPGGQPVPVDLIGPSASSADRAVARAARTLIEPPEGEPPAEVLRLARHFSLSEVLSLVSSRSDLDGLPLGQCEGLLRAVAAVLGRMLHVANPAHLYRVAPGSGVEIWIEALTDQTNAAGQWAVAEVARWMAEGAKPEEAPASLVGWMRGYNKRGVPRKQFWRVLEQTPFDFGVVQITLAKLIEALRFPYETPEHLALADALRADVVQLRRQAVRKGLSEAALRGELGHDELLEAAIALVEQPPAALRGRYDALLVDEVQDANPRQLRLYRALTRLPGLDDSYFVGDARQAIYLFRGGEPDGFAQLARQAEAEGGEVRALNTNHRSSPALVQAHRGLFGAVSGAMEREGLAGLDPLDGLQANPANARLTLDSAHHAQPEPVWLVVGEGKPRPHQQTERCLEAFLERVEAAWGEPGHDEDSAAVLVSSWFHAGRACETLNALAGKTIAFVDGGRWARHTVADDLSLWLRALLDRTDDIAWLGVYKHPSVGLTDGALARIRSGQGLQMGGQAAPGWAASLGLVARVDALVDPHDDIDQAAFARVRPALAAALDAIDRRPTAEVLEQLVHRLDWRALLAAGPGGDEDIAALEVLLDWVRSQDAAGHGAATISRRLASPDEHDLPRFRPARPQRHISCTTVYQAKGLAWDHVAVLHPGRPYRRDPWAGQSTWARLDGGEAVQLMGLRFDPTGGLAPHVDPVGRLADRILQVRYDEECLRNAYVAVTRARRSVTLSIGTPNRTTGTVERLLAQTWGNSRFDVPGVCRVLRGPVVARPPLPPHWVSVGEARSAPEAPPPGLVHHVASAAGARLERGQAERLAEHVRARVVLSGGYHAGGPRRDPPEVDGLTRANWGDIAHGWLAHWQFDGPVSHEQAHDWLIATWGLDVPGAAAWLVEVSGGLQNGPLWQRVTEPGVQLDFEWPLVGAATDGVMTGRIDLLIRSRTGVWVVDFKAGARVPTDRGLGGAGLRTYGPQLEDYRAALEQMGVPVHGVALWFVRNGAQVQW